MQKQFSTVVQPSQFIEGPRTITSVSPAALWEHTDADGKTDLVLWEVGAPPIQLPLGYRLTLLASARHPVMVTGLEPTPWMPAEVTVTVIG